MYWRLMRVLRHHYPEYLMEAAGLGLLMIAASLLATIMHHPASPIHQAIASPVLQRLGIGMGMGLTAIALVYSPWGQQSGAHFNPVVTLTYWRLGKVKFWDALFYVISQFIGGLCGVLIAAGLLRGAIADPQVNYVVTMPGSTGAGVALCAELIISFGMMLMVLRVSNSPNRGRYTGLCAGALLATYITLESPLSGTSMNPARTMASAIAAQNWTAIWVYLTAPLLGMVLASEVFVRWKGQKAVRCAKLDHHSNKRCIFCCDYRVQAARKDHLLSDDLPGLS
jgi:aquaporin Z